ncbi:MAG: hypothetical protein LC667_16480, partial [Thioalkalivibrio sp.]|nr:hypothetical protein [Thioalkalivibrio sp.]
MLAINVSPVVSGSEDLADQTVHGVIVVSVPKGHWIDSVRFLVDGEQRHAAAAAPFEYELDTRTMTNGSHVLTVEALRKNGRVGAIKSADFVVANNSDETAPPVDEADPPADEADPPSDRGPAPTTDARGLALRGDPAFDASKLTALERGEHDRLWSEIRDSGNLSVVMELAGSDDLFTYGRTLHGYVQAVLTAFRVTGDLRLLDHVDEVAERMRRELRDEWRGTNDGTDGTRDGY